MSLSRARLFAAKLRHEDRPPLRIGPGIQRIGTRQNQILFAQAVQNSFSNLQDILAQKEILEIEIPIGRKAAAQFVRMRN
jgi:hypothetical protein